MSSFFLLKWGVQIQYIFNQKQTPRSDSANLETSEPIFCPRILEPRFYNETSKKLYYFFNSTAPPTGDEKFVATKTKVLFNVTGAWHRRSR